MHRPRPLADERSITIVPANEASWEDLRAIFGNRGYAAYCHCQKNKMRSWAEWSTLQVAGRMERLRADTRWVEVAVDQLPRGDGWARTTTTWRGGRVIPGWWRRDGAYLLTVAAPGDLQPPSALPGAVDRGQASPVHSWVGRPLVTPQE